MDEVSSTGFLGLDFLKLEWRFLAIIRKCKFYLALRQVDSHLNYGRFLLKNAIPNSFLLSAVFCW